MKKILLSLLLAFSYAANATVFTDLKFGRYQIADSQWNVSACMYTASCQIYSTNPGTMYKIPWTSGQWSWQTGQYVQFVSTGNSTNPYEGKVYNSNGTLAGTIGTGHIINMGTDSNGYNLFFFVGNDNNTGQLFSTNHGFSGTNGYTWTGTLNPTTAQVDSFAATGSTSPLAAGQTSSSSSPTVTSTSTTNVVSSSSATTTSNTDSVTVKDIQNGSGTIRTYNDSFTGTATTTTTTTTTTPVTTTTYSDGSTSTSNGTTTTTLSSSTVYSIAATLGIAPVYSATSPNLSGNSVYIKQIYAWNNTQVSITQDGNNNAVTGVQEGWAKVDGNGSIISVKQYGQDNITGIKMNAWGNNININQGVNGSDVNRNILMLESFGNGNLLTLNQKSNDNSATVKMTYDINTINITQQTGTLNKSYTTILGNWNTANTAQTGSGNFALINISGDQNYATINQTGSDHSAMLNLIGNRNNVSVTQMGTGDAYSLQQTCTNPSGCGVSIIRNK
jgi:hypothetical protein